MATTGTATFGLDEDTPGHARSWSRAFLSDALSGFVRRDDLADDVTLVVSELVTNAIRAMSAKTVVTLYLDRVSVMVSVTDTVQALPEPRAAGPNDVTGRGLGIVAALSADWGVKVWTVGKTVWAEIVL